MAALVYPVSTPPLYVGRERRLASSVRRFHAAYVRCHAQVYAHGLDRRAQLW